MTDNPYQNRPDRQFWKRAVEQRSPLNTTGLFTPRWALDRTDRIATAGSCFAQHIGRHLRGTGLTVIDAEPAPPTLLPQYHVECGFGMYSARYGNIYTARQLLQLLREAFGDIPQRNRPWAKGRAVYDAFRPGVEPDGFADRDQLTDNRRHHLAMVRAVFEEMDVFVFTLGLTEAWEDVATGDIYPVAPGTIAGDYDPATCRFVNFDCDAVCSDLEAALALLHDKRGGRPFRMLLTVSPVPLTATACDDHVLVASSYSKAVLRAVAGQMAQRHAFIDYFPSYEIVTAPHARSVFFAANLRSVTAEGVAVVMRTFETAYGLATTAPAAAPAPHARSADDIACEEALLERLIR